VDLTRRYGGLHHRSRSVRAAAPYPLRQPAGRYGGGRDGTPRSPPLGAVDDQLTARAYHQLGLGLLPHSRAQQTSALALARRRFFRWRLSHHRPSRLSGQIVGPVLAPRPSLVATRMEFERDAPVGPARFPWRAWLPAHGAAHPGEHVWSRNRRQREVWSRFLPSAWSSSGGALWPAGWRETIVRWLILPGKSRRPSRAISHSPGRPSVTRPLAGGTGWALRRDRTLR
jgi:hypothetical protein